MSEMNVLFEQLISKERFRQSSISDRNITTEAESDRGRLIYSPAFRRLQQKAQVFSLESNAAVRSRLTHSIEVSQTGRFIADLIVQNPHLESLDPFHISAFITFIETACLMHDIGNPPFGHFGEAAIKDWFKQKGSSYFEESTGEKDTDQKNLIISDFINFDGNPQGLRIVAKLQRNNDEHGLNLTKTTLGGFMKYVRGPHEEEKSNAFKKIGYFSTEANLFNWISRDYKIINRHPFAYIIEAADDIAYCLSDIEDGIEKHIITQNSAFKEINKIYTDKLNDHALPVDNRISSEILTLIGKEGATYTDFRVKVSKHLCQMSAERFWCKASEILNFDFQDSLLGDKTIEGLFLISLREYCRKNVYSHRSVHKIEYAGYKAIFGLLDCFGDLLKINLDDFDRVNGAKQEKCKLLLAPKLYTLIPARYIETYKEDRKKSNGINSEWNIRAHLITDYICGMTDDFAMKTYRELTGIEIGK